VQASSHVGKVLEFAFAPGNQFLGWSTGAIRKDYTGSGASWSGFARDLAARHLVRTHPR